MQPTPKLYNSLMGSFFKNLRIEGALELFREMQDLNCAPNVFTYTELIKGLGKAGRIDDAWKMFVKMRHRGCSLDTVLINNLINIMSKNVKIDEALRLFDEMKTLNCLPNVVTFNIIIKGLLPFRLHSLIDRWPFRLHKLHPRHCSRVLLVRSSHWLQNWKMTSITPCIDFAQERG